jgi:hypothetical protein
VLHAFPRCQFEIGSNIGKKAIEPARLERAFEFGRRVRQLPIKFSSALA